MDNLIVGAARTRCVCLLRYAGRLAALGVLVGLAACAAPQTPPADTVTVVGEVTARGNEPFGIYLLETADRNSYVLNLERLTAAQRQHFSTPARLRLTGTPYLDRWNGRPYAHLRVQAWERVP